MKDYSQYKIVLWAILFTFLLPFLAIVFYFMVYALINQADSNIYFLNATYNKFKSDVYFSTEEVENTHFFEELTDKIYGMEEVLSQNNSNELWHFMDNHQNEILYIAMNNEEYMQYLADNDTTLEDLRIYISKMAHVDQYITLLALYITFVVILFVTLVIFDYRKAFYVTAIIVYFIAAISYFSDGLSDYLVSIPLSFVSKFVKSTFTYEDALFLRKYLVNTLKEALLTVALIDTIREMIKGNIYIGHKSDIRYTYESLEIQIDYLKKYECLKHSFIAKLAIPSAHLEKISCKNNKELSELLCFLRTNTEEIHECGEYIDMMEKTRALMISCKYNRV